MCSTHRSQECLPRTFKREGFSNRGVEEAFARLGNAGVVLDDDEAWLEGMFGKTQHKTGGGVKSATGSNSQDRQQEGRP